MGRKATHGLSKTRTYHNWARMKQLCDNSDHHGYFYVGGRGITYDPAWASFEKFLEDMGEAPPGHTLKRIHHNENYLPGNCAWEPVRKDPTT